MTSKKDGCQCPKTQSNHLIAKPQPRTQAQKLKIGTLQCFYIDQWLIWASAQGCLGRTRRGARAPGRKCKYDSSEIRYLKNRTIQLLFELLSCVFNHFLAFLVLNITFICVYG